MACKGRKAKKRKAMVGRKELQRKKEESKHTEKKILKMTDNTYVHIIKRKISWKSCKNLVDVVFLLIEVLLFFQYFFLATISDYISLAKIIRSINIFSNTTI